MAFCPNCSNDSYHEKNYSSEHDPNTIEVWKECDYCGLESEHRYYNVDDDGNVINDGTEEYDNE